MINKINNMLYLQNKIKKNQNQTRNYKKLKKF